MLFQSVLLLKTDEVMYTYMYTYAACVLVFRQTRKHTMVLSLLCPSANAVDKATLLNQPVKI